MHFEIVSNCCGDRDVGVFTMEHRLVQILCESDRLAVRRLAENFGGVWMFMAR